MRWSIKQRTEKTRPASDSRSAEDNRCPSYTSQEDSTSGLWSGQIYVSYFRKQKEKKHQECLTIQKSEAATSKSRSNCSLHMEGEKYYSTSRNGEDTENSKIVWEKSLVAFSLITGMCIKKKKPKGLEILENSDCLNNGETYIDGC